MLLAIDVGNTDLKCGIWQDPGWVGIWRRATHDGASADEVAQWVIACAQQAGIEASISSVGCASVVPKLNPIIDEASKKMTGTEAFFLTPITLEGLRVLYEPVTGLGADRVANALGALSQYGAPVIAVDFGSATTLDVVSAEGFLGGAILPGLKLQMDSLVQRTAQLPEVPLSFPPNPIGNSTIYGLQSGVVLGHLAAVEGLLVRMQKELGQRATVAATGGFAHLFMGETEAIHHFVPTLTLDGVKYAVESFGN